MSGDTVAEPFNVAHLSLWFGAQPSTVADYVAATIGTYDCRLVTCTEGKRYVRALRDTLGPEWRIQARGEHLVLSHKPTIKRYGVKPAREHLASRRAYYTRGGGGRRFRVMFADLRIIDGPRLRVMVAHAPASVQDGKHWNHAHPDRVQASRQGFDRWGKWIRRWQPKHRDAVQLAAMDSNLDQRLGVWREYLTDQLSLPSIWEWNVPDEGTHGRRLIDTAHTNAVVSGALVSKVARPKVLDHDGIVFTLHP
jgi:hypothetical protein